MLHLEIVTPEKKIFSDTVEDVYLPGEEGEMGVLEMHAALVTSLKAGELRYRKDGEVHELAIGSGFAEVTQEKVSVLTDMAMGERTSMKRLLKLPSRVLKMPCTDSSMTTMPRKLHTFRA